MVTLEADRASWAVRHLGLILALVGAGLVFVAFPYWALVCTVVLALVLLGSRFPELVIVFAFWGGDATWGALATAANLPQGVGIRTLIAVTLVTLALGGHVLLAGARPRVSSLKIPLALVATLSVYLFTRLLLGQASEYGVYKVGRFVLANVPLLAAVILCVSEEARAVRLIKCLLLVGIVQASRGVYLIHQFGWRELEWVLSKEINVIGGHIFWGRCLAVGVLSGLACAVAAKGHMQRLAYGLISMSLLGFIMLLGGRGTALSLAVGLVVYLAAASQIRWPRKLLYAAMLASVAWQAFVLAPSYSRSRLFVADPARPILWERALKQFLDNPTIGEGVGTYATPMGTERGWPHNLLLEFAGETGAVGLALITLFLVATAVKYARTRRQVLPGGAWSSVADWGVATFAFALTASMFSGDWTMQEMLWMSAGVIWAVPRQASTLPPDGHPSGMQEVRPR